MRRIRNPRYAPEYLERKLSPSTAVTTPPADVTTTPTPTPTATTSTYYSSPTTGTPVTSVYYSTPTTATDPEPPDGDGTPPVMPPTLPPTGPNGPAVTTTTS